MSQVLSLLTILSDRKTHYRDDLLKKLYKSRGGVKSGRLAARVDDLRSKGIEIESPLVRYKNGVKIKVFMKKSDSFQKTFWYRLKSPKIIWKKLLK